MSDIVDYCVGGTYTWTAHIGNLDQRACVQGELISGEDPDDADQEQSRGGQISWLRARVLKQENNETTITLMKNGSATSLSVSFSDEDDFPATYEKTGVVVMFSAGDKLHWKITFDEGDQGSETIMAYIAARVVLT